MNPPNTTHMFNIVETALKEGVEELLKTGALSADNWREQLHVRGREAVRVAKQQFYDDFCESAPEKLKLARGDSRDFQDQNRKRWELAFEYIEMLRYLAIDLSYNFDQQFRSEAAKTGDYKFEALRRLHARGMLVVAEAIHLLEGGYPDGALTRWRTLHEILVISKVLSKSDVEISHRYLVHEDCLRIKAARGVQKVAKRAKITPISEDEIRMLENRQAEIIDLFGPQMKQEYGWAYPIFSATKPKMNPNFGDLEVEVGLDDWRPRYKWASQHTHAGSREIDNFLGLSEASEPMLLLGSSDSGFFEPFQMLVLHVSSLTSNLLFIRQNPDMLVYSKVLEKLAEKVVFFAKNTQSEV